MKKRAHVAVPVFSALAIGLIFSWSFKGVEAGMKFNKKDSPEHGVSIITAADPAFQGLMSTYSGRHPQAPVNDLRPVSVFIENATEKTIVGLKLSWVCKKADGTTVDQVISETTLWALTNTLGPNTESALKRADRVVQPKSYFFISLAAPSESLTGKTVDILDPDAQQEEIRALNSELRNYTEITVNLDGLFFGDGSFIGTDDKYYERVKSEVKAREDVLKEIQSGIQQGKSVDDVFKPIEAAANGPDIRLGSGSTPREHYQYEKRLSAQEVLNIRKYKGDEKAFEHARMRLGRAWPAIHKLDFPNE